MFEAALGFFNDYPGPHRIMAVAMLTKSGRIFSRGKPFRHHHVMADMKLCGFSPEEIAESEQGFVTSWYGFATREAAYVIANESGQFNRKVYSSLKELFSEDLW